MNNVVLCDPDTGARAEVLVDLGFNCHRLQLPMADGLVDVLWAEDEFELGQRRPSGSGIPVLFPFPGRLPGASFNWQGNSYALEPGDGRGNAIHGFVYNRPWRVTDQSPTHVTACFRGSQDMPDLASRWPADFSIEMTYRLQGHRFHAQVRVENPDLNPLPCGLGLHPYFRVPLVGDQADACRVVLPVTRHWPLRDMLPVGADEPWPDSASFRQGVAFGGLQLDNVFGGLVFDEGVCRASIADPAGPATLSVAFDRAFTHCVVYNPPSRRSLCIEPYSCVPGAWLLPAPAQDSGARVLPSGEQWEANCWIELS